MRNQCRDDGKGAQGEIEQHPKSIGVAGIQPAISPARCLEHGDDQGDGQPVGDAKLKPANVAPVEGMAEEGYVYRIDRHEQDAGDTDPVHP